MIRICDFLFSAVGLTALSPLFLIVFILGMFDTGKPIFKQERVGKNLTPFSLYKFRTMNLNTRSVASHLASTSEITSLGKFLRKTKLDELPQLINVLNGTMSLVGPRPNLFNQDELIKERSCRKVYSVRPGITGLAQVNNIDMSTPKLLAETDEEMVEEFSLRLYFKLIFMTVLGKGQGDAVK